MYFQEIEKVKELDGSVSVSESIDSSVTSTNNLTPAFNSTSFLFGDKCSTNVFEKALPNVPLFGSKLIFGNVSADSTKTDDNKSSSLFGQKSTPTASIFNSFSATAPFPTLGSTESPNTSSLFSKTDDNKSKTEGLFNFSPKTDSPFKFGGLVSKDPKSVFGQGIFNMKDKPVEESFPKGTNF